MRLELGDSRDVNTQTGKSDTTIKGLGLTAASVRNVKPYGALEMYFPPKTELKRHDLILIPDSSVEDTVELMKEAAKKYKGDTFQIANYLKGRTIPETLQNIFAFVYTYIKYVPDDRFIEQVRRPLRAI